MTGRSERLRIVVLGYIVRFPLGGMAWHYLQYAVGLARLGHDVWFVEDSEDYPYCYDPTRHVTDEDPTYGLGFAARVLEEHGLGDRWCYHDAHTGTWHGPCADRIRAVLAGADLMLNISGANPVRPWLAEIPNRAFLDTDPVFEQVRQLTVPERRDLALLHNRFFSFGENIGSPVSAVPDDGLPWQPTRQPVVLDLWPVLPGPADGRYTTVMQWTSYRPREYLGVRYGLKADAFAPYLDLPRRSGRALELALGSKNAPRDRLKSHGWIVTDPLETTRTPRSYQEYIRASKAELGIAKHGFVVGRCGWFSERSAAYLASGRPVVAMDTGFTERLPVGEGLFAFTDPAGAVAAMEEVDRRYAHHCRAARQVAEEHFDARRVLAHLVERAMGPVASPTPRTLRG